MSGRCGAGLPSTCQHAPRTNWNEITDGTCGNSTSRTVVGATPGRIRCQLPRCADRKPVARNQSDSVLQELAAPFPTRASDLAAREVRLVTTPLPTHPCRGVYRRNRHREIG